MSPGAGTIDQASTFVSSEVESGSVPTLSVESVVEAMFGTTGTETPLQETLFAHLKYKCHIIFKKSGIFRCEK